MPVRAEYLDRGLTPHLLDISKKGLRAKFMKPIFPVSRTVSVSYDKSLLILIVDSDFPVSVLYFLECTEVHVKRILITHR